MEDKSPCKEIRRLLRRTGGEKEPPRALKLPYSAALSPSSRSIYSLFIGALAILCFGSGVCALIYRIRRCRTPLPALTAASCRRAVGAQPRRLHGNRLPPSARARVAPSTGRPY